MKKRGCPVCSSEKRKVIMHFSLDQLLRANDTYNKGILFKALKGYEDDITYSRCQQCGMVYCENYWDNEILTKIYRDTIDHKKSREKIRAIRKRLNLTRTWVNILRLLQMSGKKELNDITIIDFGCGWGDFLDVVKGYGVNVIGFDQDNIKTRLPLQRGHRIVNDIRRLKKIGPADVVVMNSVLEHLQDTASVLKLIKQVLRPGGLFVCKVMDYRSSFIRRNIRRLEKGFPALTKNLNPLEHVNIYDYRSMMNTLKKYKFQFLSTAVVLGSTDIPVFRKNKLILKTGNFLERIVSGLIRNKDIMIEVYAENK